MSRTNRKLRGSASIYDADGAVIGRIPVVGQFPSPPKWADGLIGARPRGGHRNRLCTVQCPAGHDAGIVVRARGDWPPLVQMHRQHLPSIAILREGLGMILWTHADEGLVFNYIEGADGLNGEPLPLMAVEVPCRECAALYLLRRAECPSSAKMRFDVVTLSHIEHDGVHSA